MYSVEGFLVEPVLIRGPEDRRYVRRVRGPVNHEMIWDRIHNCFKPGRENCGIEKLGTGGIGVFARPTSGNVQWRDVEGLFADDEPNEP